MGLSVGFDEVRLVEGVMQHLKLKVQYPVSIIPLASGLEQRVRHRQQARRRYELEAETMTPELARALVAFHAARGGAFRGFRLRDPLDFALKKQVIGSGDGRATRFPIVAGSGDSQRRILKPVAAGAQVSVAGVALSPAQFQVDESDGSVVLTTAPAMGQAVEVSLSFDVPVRFETAGLALESRAGGGFCLKPLGLVELLAEAKDAPR